MVLMKRKIVTRVVAALLVFSALFSLTGCRGLMFTVDGSMMPYIPQAKYETGNRSHSISRNGPVMCVRSQKSEFQIDEVNIELSFAFFNHQYGPQEELFYPNTDTQLCGILYLGDGTLKNTDFVAFESETKEELYDREGRLFIKELTQEELFTYGYSKKAFIGFVYDHTEIIHIPEEFFAEEEGKQNCIHIEFIPFESTNGSSWEQHHIISRITLYFEQLENNTVRIRF